MRHSLLFHLTSQHMLPFSLRICAPTGPFLSGPEVTAALYPDCLSTSRLGSAQQVQSQKSISSTTYTHRDWVGNESFESGLPKQPLRSESEYFTRASGIMRTCEASKVSSAHEKRLQGRIEGSPCPPPPRSAPRENSCFIPDLANPCYIHSWC